MYVLNRNQSFKKSITLNIIIKSKKAKPQKNVTIYIWANNIKNLNFEQNAKKASSQKRRSAKITMFQKISNDSYKTDDVHL